MEGTPELRADGPAARPSPLRWLPTLAWLGLFAWQGWMTLSLFGPSDRWRHLVDDEPIVSGRHPVHLYHGYLGARSLWENGTTSCFDPAFDTGYPKTPLFDAGCRPAELSLAVAGGAYRPAAYKACVALACLLVPGLLAVAAFVLGLNRVHAFAVTFIGLFALWSGPGRRLIEAGDIDVLLAGVLALVQTTLLVRFDRFPGIGAWAGLVVVGAAGLYVSPLLFGLLMCLGLGYYLSVGTRHGLLWHVGLFGGLAGALALNEFWLADWFRAWWVLSPVNLDPPMLAHRTLPLLWAAPVWGDGGDRLFGLTLMAAAGVGVWRLNGTQGRTAARLLGLGTAGLLFLVLTGLVWEPLSRAASPRLLVPTLWFASLPAVVAGGWVLEHLGRRLGGYRRGLGLAVATLGVIGGLLHTPCTQILHNVTRTPPLRFGIPVPGQAAVAALIDHTTAEARILWEDEPPDAVRPHWSALLPLLTGRSFVGGLDCDADTEHSFASLRAGHLAGRPITAWTDADLADYCRRYNVGWVVCSSASARERLDAWNEAEPVASVGELLGRRLYRVPGQSFILKGQARIVSIEANRVALADVVPEDGKVVLSLHYQPGLRVSPARVRAEKEVDPHDPVPFLRLKLTGPVARLTLTWPGP